MAQFLSSSDTLDRMIPFRSATLGQLLVNGCLELKEGRSSLVYFFSILVQIFKGGWVSMCFCVLQVPKPPGIRGHDLYPFCVELLTWPSQYEITQSCFPYIYLLLFVLIVFIFFLCVMWYFTSQRILSCALKYLCETYNLLALSCSLCIYIPFSLSLSLSLSLSFFKYFISMVYY